MPALCLWLDISIYIRPTSKILILKLNLRYCVAQKNSPCAVGRKNFTQSSSSSSVALQHTMSLSFLWNPLPILHIPGDHHDPRIPNFLRSSTTPSIDRCLGQPTLLFPWFFWIFQYCPLFAGELPIATFLI